MPGLQSFCVCTALALASISLLQLSWFSAWLGLDERRREAGRSSLLPCLLHPQSSKPSQAGVGGALSSARARLRVVSVYERLSRSPLYKALVITVAAALLSCGILGWSRIVQKFDPTLLLPAESYLRQWLQLNSQFYDSFWSGEIYSGPLTQTDLASVDSLVLGRHTWQILNDSRQCEDGSNYSHSLSLSSCAEQQFSCDDGSCVDMTLREAFNIF